MNKITHAVTSKELLSVRIILFMAFLGHAIVSLHVSEGYNLHYKIFSSVNIFDLDVEQALRVFGIFDLTMAFLFLLNIFIKYIAPIAIIYLLVVGVSGGVFFMQKTGGLFGVAELFRRVPWMFCSLFTWYITVKQRKLHYLLRVGIAFAFIAHGLASLGFFGLNGGHVELASKILSEEAASKFVYWSGITDSIMGVMLMSGLLSRWAAILGTVWLAFIVFLSVQVGIPEGIFRTGFFLMCLYVAMDKRCHSWKFENTLIIHNQL